MSDVIKTLSDRVVTFFRVLPAGQSAGLGELALDLSKDELKELVPATEAENAAKRAEKGGAKLPEKKADLLDFGRTVCLNEAMEKAVEDKQLTRRKLEGVGMGWEFTGERQEAEPVGKVKQLRLDAITVDKSVQQRDDGTDMETVERYTAVVDRLPPMRVYHYKNASGNDVYLLSRGFHRILAFKNAGWDMVPVEVVEGDREDAILDAAGDNATHGRPRTARDVAKAIGTLLGMRKYKNASTAWLADTVGCAWATADKHAKRWRRENEREETGKRTSRTGHEYPASIKNGPPTQGEAPAVEIPVAAPVVPPTGVKDKTGADITDPDIARAFSDDRFGGAVNSAIRLVKFLREFRTEGYAFSSLSVKERETILADMERGLTTLQLSVPHMAAKPDEKLPEALGAAKRRGWYTKAESDAVVKVRDKAKEAADKEAKAQAKATKGKGKEAAATSQGETSKGPENVPATAA